MKQFFLMLGMGVIIMSCHKRDSNPAPDPEPKPYLKLNVTSFSFPPLPGVTAELIVESNINWKASISATNIDNETWARINKTSGHGNDTIRITSIKENPYGGTVYFGAVTITPVDTAIKLQAIAGIEQTHFDIQMLTEKTLGGTGDDRINDIVPISDGGFFLTGTTSSNKNGDVGTNHGDLDAWMVKLNSNCDTVWTRVMGGTWADETSKAIATTDGGFVIAGNTQSSNTGDVGTNNGKTDWWIIKLKSNGDTAWTKLVGGSGDDYANGIAATADGGFIVVGSNSTSGSEDVMVAKFNSNGDIAWQKIYGGSNMDKASAITIYPNGSMMIAATTSSNNSGDVGANHGLWDYWIIKLTATGNKEWMRVYGGDQFEAAFALAATADGGAVIVGSTSSNKTGDVGQTGGKEDMWMLKVNINGDKEWTERFGVRGTDIASAIKVTPDGSYLVAGYTNSDNLISGGATDLCVVRLDSKGLWNWYKTFGGSAHDEGSALLLNTDGTFYVAGNTESSGHGMADGWLTKIKFY